MSSFTGTTRINIQQFNEAALDLFYDQALNVPVYASFLRHIECDPVQVKQPEQIPFLPIRFFKTHHILRSGVRPEVTFTSSGTGTEGQSAHHVGDAGQYEEVSIQGFEMQYGPIKDWAIFALLPSYLEREGSSLIYMIDRFMKVTPYKGGFYLSDHDQLLKDIRRSDAPKKLLIGVSFALLDLASRADAGLEDVKGLVVMETGGMKGRRKELTRIELHRELKAGLGVHEIHSEYGMTELLSQAYAREGGVFQCPPWMKVMIRDVDDPFSLARRGKTGGINIIDLANRDSCAFIATDDLGRLSLKNDTFEVLGRFDHSDTRGCNLLIIK